MSTERTLSSEDSPPFRHRESGAGDAGSPGSPQRRIAKPWRGRIALVFFGVALVWLCLDMLSKGIINAAYAQGDVITGPILGLVRLRLIYNTGAAWGMFGDATVLLGVLSLVVCLVLAAYLFFLSPRPNVLETVGVALVVAGGLGNAIDRFTLGYVVDFIEPVFINFPVFNVADVGVTCGFVLFVLGIFLAYRHVGAQSSLEAATPAAPDGADADKVDEKACVRPSAAAGVLAEKGAVVALQDDRERDDR